MSVHKSKELNRAGVPEGLVRVSVGLETVEDILADFEQSLLEVWRENHANI